MKATRKEETRQRRLNQLVLVADSSRGKLIRQISACQG
jgi:hypothetical protein